MKKRNSNQRNNKNKLLKSISSKENGIRKISKQEIEVAEFYIERKAYIAAVSRADYILSNMPNAPEIKRALEIKVEAYELMGKEDLANQAREILNKYISVSG